MPPFGNPPKRHSSSNRVTPTSGNTRGDNSSTASRPASDSDDNYSGQRGLATLPRSAEHDGRNLSVELRAFVDALPWRIPTPCVRQQGGARNSFQPQPTLARAFPTERTECLHRSAYGPQHPVREAIRALAHFPALVRKNTQASVGVSLEVLAKIQNYCTKLGTVDPLELLRGLRGEPPRSRAHPTVFIGRNPSIPSIYRGGAVDCRMTREVANSPGLQGTASSSMRETIILPSASPISKSGIRIVVKGGVVNRACS